MPIHQRIASEELDPKESKEMTFHEHCWWVLWVSTVLEHCACLSQYFLGLPCDCSRPLASGKESRTEGRPKDNLLCLRQSTVAVQRLCDRVSHALSQPLFHFFSLMGGG